MKNGFAKDLISGARTSVKRCMGKIGAAVTVVSCYGIMTPIIVRADASSWASEQAGVEAEGIDIEESIISFVGGLGTVLGVIMAAIGVFVLVQAFRNEDVDGKHRAGLYLGIAAAMFGLRTILEAFLGG